MLRGGLTRIPEPWELALFAVHGEHARTRVRADDSLTATQSLEAMFSVLQHLDHPFDHLGLGCAGLMPLPEASD
jgi:hypothetical protein